MTDFRIAHATQAVGTYPNDGELGTDEWNADHVFEGSVPIANGGTGAGTGPAGANALDGYLNIVSSASPYALTNASPRKVFVSGTEAQTITLPELATITLGWSFMVINGSTGDVTLQAAGGGSLAAQNANETAHYVYTVEGGSGAAAWSQSFTIQQPDDLVIDGGNF